MINNGNILFKNGIEKMFIKLIQKSQFPQQPISQKPISQQPILKPESQTTVLLDKDPQIPSTILSNEDKKDIKSVSNILFKNDIIVEFKENNNLSERYCYDFKGKLEPCDGQGELPSSERDLSDKILDLLTRTDNQKQIQELAADITDKIKKQDEIKQTEIINQLRIKYDELTSQQTPVKDILGQIITRVLQNLKDQTKTDQIKR